MTTATAPAASRLPVDLDAAAGALVTEIERFLAARIRTTAHPLVTKTTAQLVAEALGGTQIRHRDETAATLTEPSAWLRLLPDWALSVPLLRQLHGDDRHITAAEHLELTALVIERFGWCSRGLRSRSGRRCILGAQAVLYRLGYGDEQTVAAAGDRLQAVLTRRGITQPYYQWNDGPDRDQGEVLYLVRQAADDARRAA